MSNILYVYGTLRPGGSDTVEVPGEMFSLGHFPGVYLGGIGTVVCEKIEVEDWAAVDRYEGFVSDDLEGSLYIRRPFRDGFIYEFNRDVDPSSKIKSGDWLVYQQEEREKV